MFKRFAKLRELCFKVWNLTHFLTIKLFNFHQSPWEMVLELWLDILSSRVILMIFSVRLSTLGLSSHLFYGYCLSKVFNSFLINVEV